MNVVRFFLAIGASFAFVSAALAENETDRFFARAFEKAKPQMENMLICFDFVAIKFAVQTCEPAETVVQAAYGACHTVEEEYVATVMKNADLSREAVMDGLSEGKRQLSQVLLATVLKARIDSGRCQ